MPPQRYIQTRAVVTADQPTGESVRILGPDRRRCAQVVMPFAWLVTYPDGRQWVCPDGLFRMLFVAARDPRDMTADELRAELGIAAEMRDGFPPEEEVDRRRSLLLQLRGLDPDHRSTRVLALERDPEAAAGDLLLGYRVTLATNVPLEIEEARRIIELRVSRPRDEEEEENPCI